MQIKEDESVRQHKRILLYWLSS